VSSTWGWAAVAGSERLFEIADTVAVVVAVGEVSPPVWIVLSYPPGSVAVGAGHVTTCPSAARPPWAGLTPLPTHRCHLFLVDRILDPTRSLAPAVRLPAVGRSWSRAWVDAGFKDHVKTHGAVLGITVDQVDPVLPP
jgi:hypothetical protein